MAVLAPSILAADLTDLGRALDQCAAGGADRVHVDVMDGHFVPNLSFGLPVVAALAGRTRLPLDVHLMIENPETMAVAYADAGAWQVLVHLEVTRHVERLLESLRGRGVRAGLAVNPTTPIEALRDAAPYADHLLVMSVNPGFAGQKFLPAALDRARRLRSLVAMVAPGVEIGMDGGLGRDNIRQAIDAGVESCVVGSAVFSAADPAAEIRTLRRLAETRSA
jgi:ribulose-phosphate 3-epimerase